MVASSPAGTLSRRRLLIAGCSAAVPFTAHGIGVYTPHELAQSYASRVPQSLRLPGGETRLYAGMAELQLMLHPQALDAPQYVLVVDRCPNVQAAFLFWRLVAGSYQLIGASPASTGCQASSDHFETPQGVFEHVDVDGRPVAAGCESASPPSCRRDGHRVYDFGVQRARLASGTGRPRDMRLQMRAADRAAERYLGVPGSDGCILLPASLIDFVDDFGLLDGPGEGRAPRRPPRHVLPFRGRHLLVVDSERDERPSWSPSPL